MRKIAVLWGVLFLVSSAQAQPDNGPGMGQIEPPVNDAPIAVDERVVIDDAKAALQKLNHPAGKMDLSTPEATVRSFVSAFQSGDVKTARQCVQGAQPYEKLLAYEIALKQGAAQLNFLISDLHSYPMRGNRATVTFSIMDIVNLNLNDGFISERLHLVRENAAWLILPDKNLEEPNHDLPVEDFFAFQATTLVSPDAFVKMNANAQLASCQSNLKQIGLGILQFLQDWDEKFDLHADWQKQLLPYIRNEVIFQCPEARPGEISYVLNPELENILQVQINQPAQTIMVYEGKDKLFEFRHMNKTMTNIAFADGHVKAFTKPSLDEALQNGTVRWQH